MPYGNVERYVARALDRFPSLRRTAKHGYQRVNYLLHGRAGFRFRLHRLASMRTQAVWAGQGGPPRPELQEFVGYYDVQPWSTDMRFSLAHRWAGAETCDIVVYDRSCASALFLGRTRAWNFQQGSRTQWLPHTAESTVLFNDVVERCLVTRIVGSAGGERICPFPVQSVAPDGSTAISLNYLRLAKLNAEYGYVVDVDNFDANLDAGEDGLWLVELPTGRSRLVIRLRELIEQKPHPDTRGAQHKVNHVIHSPDGQRFVFVHRWIGPHGKCSRLYVANADGSDVRLLLDDRMVSHYSWRDDRYLLVWARARHGDRYYLLDVTDGALQVIGRDVLDRYGDGHPSYSPDGRWIVTDTYPDRARQRHLLLFDTLTEKLIEVGRFFAPWTFDGPTRCDLHPRWSPDGRLISIDSAHDGTRRSYCIDVGSIIDEMISPTQPSPPAHRPGATIGSW